MAESSNPPRRLIRPPRDPGLDALRGLLQLFIFVGHIPLNWVATAIHRSWGFSDSSELFVYLSGMTLGSLFALRHFERGWVTASVEIWRRAGKLLVRHVWMTVLFAAVVFELGGMALVAEFRLQTLLTDPWRALSALPFLAWQPVFMDILPLFVVAMVALPLAMLVPRNRPWLGLVPWLALWLFVQATGVNLPTWPDGLPWTFNPFTWLPLFMMGAWIGRAALFGERLIPRRQWMLTVALSILAVGVVVRGSWTLYDFGLPVPPLAESIFWPLDKVNLGWAPAIHSVCLIYVVAWLLPRDRGFLVGRVGRLLAACGRVSLDLFCLGLFLSLFARLTVEAFGGSDVALAAVNLIGLAVLLAFGQWRGAVHQTDENAGESNSDGCLRAPV
jgi:hypothetical protein